MIVVEAAQRFLVGPQPILGVDVVAQEIGQDRRALGRDDLAEAAVAVGVVAVEVDGRDLGASAFVDLEHDVNPVLAQIHDLRRHLGVVTADAVVGFLDRLDVGVQHILRERPARLELHGGGKLGVLELLVALEKNLVDDRIFVDLDDQRRARLVDADVGKQPGREQPLHGLVDVGVRKRLAGRDVEIAANRLGIDPLIALNFDAANDRSLRERDKCELHCDCGRHNEPSRQSHRRSGA